VLLNLLINANKFTEGGCISVYCTMRCDKLYLTVTDQGKGINKEDQSKLFMPFDTINLSQDLDSSGTGVGLSICRNVLTEIGCKIWLVKS
jgi:signal transduction histidine kinase